MVDFQDSKYWIECELRCYKRSHKSFLELLRKKGSCEPVASYIAVESECNVSEMAHFVRIIKFGASLLNASANGPPYAWPVVYGQLFETTRHICWSNVRVEMT
jgi:hypothetical protein